MSKKENPKWEITIDAMMIIGKYLESNKDFINVMRVAKKFHEIVEMYHFNPINDYSLFINMETQHFYYKKKITPKPQTTQKQTKRSFLSRLLGRYNNKQSNVDEEQQKPKKEGMIKYIYWYIDQEVAKNIQPNEIMKINTPYEYIERHIHDLEAWSGLNYDKVLYDSDNDDKSTAFFSNTITSHQHLYFIVIDSNNNVFGHYHDGVITGNGCHHDKGIFMFSLHNDERCGAIKFDCTNEYAFTFVYGGTKYYDTGYDTYTSYTVSKLDTIYSSVDGHIEDGFKDMKVNKLIGTIYIPYFNAKRIIIIQMK